MKASLTRGAMWVCALTLATSGLAACGGSDAPAGSDGAASGGGAGGKDPDAFTVLSANENTLLPEILDSLAAGACKTQNGALPIKHEKVAQADVVQKITLLASQGAMSPHTIAGTALIRPDGDLGKAGLVQDLTSAMEASGSLKNVLPAAVSTEQKVYGGFTSMPYQYNIEGIWYNKKIFADNGVSEPKTWAELGTASKTLLDAGVTPMTLAGADGWPVTRLIGMHVMRTVGPNAMADIRDGKAKLTDAPYVDAARAVAEYTKAGNLGEGFSTRDGNASQNLFLTGEAAMTYDGTWALSAINDAEQNKIGLENVGFMPFPAVEGGAGSIDQYPANAGAPMIFNAKEFGPKVSAWVDCIAQNYGSVALQDHGVISGFTVNTPVTGVSPVTEDIQKRIAGIKEAVLWFEALFDPKTNSLASSNVSQLATGSMSPEDYMSALQESIDANG